MVKRLLMKLIWENGIKLMRSVFNAYKDVNKNKPNDSSSKTGESSKFSFSNFVSTPMTRDEALKILNLKEDELSPQVIMEKFEKYYEANDPEKGGSFYIQNKIYYAKEYLMQDYPIEDNQSKFNP